ncbi:hypothetical protein CK203_090828 [Vitis vinifera]|uniref:Uncharacterized protein n=1 Tax=Vitis vinifera TaxID=29760 RepID=A0A438D504_VITVI|nr:hypothetical protein CK203_090828 [Vitis vinifera]
MQPCPRFPCQPPPPSPCACQDFRLLALCGLSSLKSTNQTLSSTTPSSGATPKAPLHSLFFVQLDEGELELPRQVMMKYLGDVSWTVMVSMYAQAKRSREPLELFREIRDVRVRPTDVVTMVSVMLLMSLLLLLSENFRFAPGVTTKPLQAPG